VQEKLDELAKQISMCTRCSLRQSATQPVPGIGEGRKYFVLGEAPASSEDRAGVPFVGASGKRLNQLLELAKIDSRDCYITNVCKCRPPKVSGKFRAPRKAERLACYPFLKEELKIVHPEIIVTLGSTPLSLFSEYGVTQMHGTEFDYNLKLDDQEFPVTIWSNYHPAASLHQPRLWAVLLDDWEHRPNRVDASYTVVNEKPRFFNQLLALDTETDNKGGIGQWSVAYRNPEGELVVQPFYGADKDLQFNGQVIMQNAKYDLRELKKAGMNLPKPENVLDSMIMAYCLGLGRQEPRDTGKSGDNLVGGLGLKYLARRHLGMRMITWDEVKDKPELQPEYNAADSVATYLLYEKWKPELPQHFWDIDMPLLDVLMAMEDRGIKVDSNFIKTYAEEIDLHLDELKKELPINPYATKDVSKFVYETLGYPIKYKTPTGQPSVTKEALEGIDDPIVKRIVEYKDFYQERGTYIGNYVNRLDLESRIHCEFKQTSTATGRLSAAKPNLQNVTKDREDKPNKLRDLFIAKEGFTIVRVDWKLIEFGALASLAKDEHLMEAFTKSDVHQVTADDLGIDRDTAKHINFLIQNGGGAWGMSREYHIPIDQAKRHYDAYMKRYPAIKRFQDETVEIAKSTGHITGYFGRKHRIDSLYSDEWKTRQDGEKEAKTYPMQNCAAEIVKRAMLELHYKHKAPMLLQVHDELLFEIPEKDAIEYAHWLQEYLPTITEVNGVKFPVEASTGRTWLESMQKSRRV
jgi:uracil-DNA glycosylase family 4